MSVPTTAAADPKTPSPARVTAWTIDQAHSNVEFAVRHLMITTVRGRFGTLSGAVTLDEQNPAANSVNVTIDVTSIDTREAQRDTHLRSADFFDVEHHPTITFRSTHVARVAADRYTVTGELTIRGASREVVLDVLEEGRTKDPWGGQRLGFSVTTKIKRSEFGLTWNQLLEAGGVAVGDEIKISADVQLVKQG
jgi:polyisoprenoid-binding protein YceI